MHVCIIGAGGLGLVVGACLAESGVDVSLVARPRHVEAVRSRGLVVTGIRGDRTVRDRLVAVADPSEIEGSVDVLVLATKTRDTDAALLAAHSLRHRTANALSLQNSVTKDEKLAAWIGDDRVVGASTTEAGTVTGDGEVRHVATAPTSTYVGDLSPSPTVSTRVQEIAAMLSAAGIATRTTTQITAVEWEKLLQIALVAGFSASTLGFRPGAAFAHGIATRPGAEHYVTMANELLAVYRALGHQVHDWFAPYSRFAEIEAASFADAVEAVMTQGATMIADGILGRPSLHEDLVHGRPTELDESLGVFLEAADRLCVPVPTVRGAWRVIRANGG